MLLNTLNYRYYSSPEESAIGAFKRRFLAPWLSTGLSNAFRYVMKEHESIFQDMIRTHEPLNSCSFLSNQSASSMS